MSLNNDQVEVGYGTTNTCAPTTEKSTEVEKVDYAICRTNSASLVLRDLAVELEKHDAVSAAMIRQQLFITSDVVHRLMNKKQKLFAAAIDIIHTRQSSDDYSHGAW